VVVESPDDFLGVEISIAGAVGEMVRANYCDRFFFFFFFFFLISLFHCFYRGKRTTVLIPRC